MAASPSTIFALSSAPGRSGVAVIRISGPEAARAVLALCGAPLPEARRAALRTIRHPETGETLDRGLVLWFPEGASFTGEPSAELQVHGSRAVIAGVLGALAACPGCQPAQPGEFTRRAFENGKLDLAQVEALDDLIQADTAAQRRQAFRGLEGRLGERVRDWRQQLLMIRSLLAAEIDFADEGDVGSGLSREIDSLVLRLVADMRRVLSSSRMGRIVAGGYRVAILGRPNSGKSTLLNALSGSDSAIVSDVPGTTRDVIEVRVDWEGFEVVLLDTAGLRETHDPVEVIGIQRALARAADADLRVWIDPDADWSVIGADQEEGDSIRVRSKCDIDNENRFGCEALGVSALTGYGMNELKMAIIERIRGMGPAEDVLVIRERQANAMGLAADALDRLLGLQSDAIELRDHEVRAAETALDALLGRVGVEEMLGAVFGRFCIGK